MGSLKKTTSRYILFSPRKRRSGRIKKEGSSNIRIIFGGVDTCWYSKVTGVSCPAPKADHPTRALTITLCQRPVLGCFEYEASRLILLAPDAVASQDITSITPLNNLLLSPQACASNTGSLLSCAGPNTLRLAAVPSELVDRWIRSDLSTQWRRIHEILDSSSIDIYAITAVVVPRKYGPLVLRDLFFNLVGSTLPRHTLQKPSWWFMFDQSEEAQADQYIKSIWIDLIPNVSSLQAFLTYMFSRCRGSATQITVWSCSPCSAVPVLLSTGWDLCIHVFSLRIIRD